MIRIPVEEGLYLRTLEPDDAEGLFALTDSNRAYLRRWLPWLDVNQTVDDTRSFIELAMRQMAGNAGFQAGIWRDYQLAGVAGYHHLDWPNRSTNIGYWLGERFQGRGIMTKSCAVLVDYAFENWSLRRVEIRCATGNLKSRAIPDRLGFRCEGVLREAEWLYDHFVDHAVYGMLATEWKDDRRTMIGQVTRAI
ncbi:MAG: GNAT family N-acetyltransferase [Ignavibacteria bacterium]|nr:GNAT family N-acetyltransferase [Ignavibacteria bacterium]